MLDHDAEESGCKVLTTPSLFGKHEIDPARNLKVMQEIDNKFVISWKRMVGRESK